ncbi:MAG: HNH endonuclease [Alkalilacustris sp.]
MNAAVANLRTLVLNADMQPLSWAPLSVWSWQDAFVAVIQGRVIQVKTYDDVLVRSASESYEIPAVIALKRYRKRKRAPFTRFNLFLRDEFRCQYCGERFEARDLTFDHVIPRSRGGMSCWTNIVAACRTDNIRKANLTPQAAGMKLLRTPFEPSPYQLDTAARQLPWVKTDLHQTWMDFLYWDSELDG